MKISLGKNSARKIFVGAAMLIAGFAAACGGGPNVNPVIPPTGMYSTSSLKGTYAFSMSGEDGNGNPIYRLGSFQADGAGNITAAIEDVNDAGAPSSFVFTAAPSSAMCQSAPIASSRLNKNGTAIRLSASMSRSPRKPPMSARIEPPA